MRVTHFVASRPTPDDPGGILAISSPDQSEIRRPISRVESNRWPEWLLLPVYQAAKLSPNCTTNPSHTIGSSDFATHDDRTSPAGAAPQSLSFCCCNWASHSTCPSTTDRAPLPMREDATAVRPDSLCLVELAFRSVRFAAISSDKRYSGPRSPLHDSHPGRIIIMVRRHPVIPSKQAPL